MSERVGLFELESQTCLNGLSNDQQTAAQYILRHDTAHRMTVKPRWVVTAQRQTSIFATLQDAFHQNTVVRVTQDDQATGARTAQPSGSREQKAARRQRGLHATTHDPENTYWQTPLQQS